MIKIVPEIAARGDWWFWILCVQIGQIILEIVQWRLNGAVVVVRIQRLKANISQRDVFITNWDDHITYLILESKNLQEKNQE